MSKTAQWARVLDAAMTDPKPMPISYAGMEREWLLGTLIAKVESIAMYRDLGMDDHADKHIAEAMAAIATHKAATEQGARVEDVRGRQAARMWAGGYR
jgi:hypothetical protein